jgi:hypothetical protein
VSGGSNFSWFGYQQDDNARQRSEQDRTKEPTPETNGASPAKITDAERQYYVSQEEKDVQTHHP